MKKKRNIAKESQKLAESVVQFLKIKFKGNFVKNEFFHKVFQESLKLSFPGFWRRMAIFRKHILSYVLKQ